jgi:hypothetical protein
MQGRSHTAWKQNPTITIMFHESIAILLKNAPFFEVPLTLGLGIRLIKVRQFRVEFLGKYLVFSGLGGLGFNFVMARLGNPILTPRNLDTRCQTNGHPRKPEG